MSAENDPWHEAKKWLEQCRTTTDLATKRQIELVCYLDDEIDRLTKRVANLEKASEIVRRLAEWAESDLMGDFDQIASDAVVLWAEMQAKGGEQ